MQKNLEYTIAPVSIVGRFLADFAELVKLRLTLMVVFSALASYLVASGLDMNGLKLLLLGLGGFCVAGASNVMNQVLEKDYDCMMLRTKNRPVTAGRMSVSKAVLIAGFLLLFGITNLSLFNPTTALSGMLAFILYAFVYTPLKRYSPAAIFVGAVAGAMPMLIGAVAWQGGITWLAISLFAVQFLWQYPHFWSIGYLGYEEYQKAGFRFIPGTSDGSPDRSIGRSSVFYSGLLILLVGLMVFNHSIGWFSGSLAMVCSFGYFGSSISFMKTFDRKTARILMFASLLYLPLVLLIFILDKM